MDTERLKYELRIQLINLYFQSLINYDLYQAATSQSKLSEQLVLAEETKMESGKSTVLDSAQAKSKLANDQLNLTNAKNAFDLSIFKLKQLLELDKEIELVKPINEQKQTLIKEYFIDVNDTYLKIVNSKIDQSLINTKIAKSAYYPTLTFNTGYGTKYSSQRFTSAYSSKIMPVFDQMNNNRSLYLNFTLSYNILDKNITKTNVIKSNINTESLKLEREKVIRERIQIYNQLKLEWSAAVKENKAIESAYASSKLNYEAMKERFEVGKNSSLDLFKALTDFNMNEFRKITSSYNILLKEELIKLQLID